MVRLVPFARPGPDRRPIAGSDLFEQQLPPRVQRVVGTPHEVERPDERAAGFQVVRDPSHRLGGGLHVGHELDRAGCRENGAVPARQVQQGHVLQVQRRFGKPIGGCFGAHDVEHLRRAVQSLDVDALTEVVEHQSSGCTAEVEHRPTEAPDDVEVKATVRPRVGVVTPQVPGGNSKPVVGPIVAGHVLPPSSIGSVVTP